MKSTINKFGAGALVACALFASTGLSQGATTMQDLLAGGSITNGDKIFYNFHNASQVGDLFVPYASINVVPILIGSDYGISFQSGLWSLAGPGKTYDLAFDFDLRTVSGLALIKDDTLSIVGGYNGGGHAQIAETVTQGSTSIANELVWLNVGGTDKTIDHDNFLGTYADIAISKDFAMNTGVGSTDQIFVSHFDQSFSQVQIPEPATTLGGLLVAAGMLVRRRAR